MFSTIKATKVVLMVLLNYIMYVSIFFFIKISVADLDTQQTAEYHLLSCKRLFSKNLLTVRLWRFVESHIIIIVLFNSLSYMNDTNNAVPNTRSNEDEISLALDGVVVFSVVVVTNSVVLVGVAGWIPLDSSKFKER